MAMIQCPNCNSTIDDTGATFCPNCGAPVAQQPVYQQPEQPVYQQPVYQQPVYQQPVYAAAPVVEKRSNPFGIVGFILDLISLIFCWIPFVGTFISWLSIPGVILSIVGVARKDAKKGLAITGLILGVIALLVWIIYLFVYGAAAESAYCY